MTETLLPYPVYLATRNRHKAIELAQLLGGGAIVRTAQDIDPALDWDETGTTFEDNARIKARVVADALGARGIVAWVLADDSGLSVDALSGAPGVISAHYAGVHGDTDANNARLLRELGSAPARADGLYPARFTCCLCFLDERGRESLHTGTCEGWVTTRPRGAHGFGYDPLFVVEGQGGRTMAELPDALKNAVSHRGRAIGLWRRSIGFLEPA